MVTAYIPVCIKVVQSIDPTKEKLLCIQDLPQQYTFNSNAFKFEYGDFVSGFVDVVDGEFILSGA